MLYPPLISPVQQEPLTVFLKSSPEFRVKTPFNVILSRIWGVEYVTKWAVQILELNQHVQILQQWHCRPSSRFSRASLGALSFDNDYLSSRRLRRWLPSRNHNQKPSKSHQPELELELVQQCRNLDKLHQHRVCTDLDWLCMSSYSWTLIHYDKTWPTLLGGNHIKSGLGSQQMCSM